MANEKRLIDADAFGMYLADVQLANRGWKDDVCEFLEDVMDALDDAPTVNAVELPCKIGQKVYTIPRSAIREWTVCGVWISADEKCSYAHIYWEKNGHRMESRPVKFCDLDKTVFLTREEAEAALAKMDGDGNE